MTIEPVSRHRKFSVSELQSAVAEIAVAQAQIGIAVLALLNEPTGGATEERDRLGRRVVHSVEALLEVSGKLLDSSDGP